MINLKEIFEKYEDQSFKGKTSGRADLRAFNLLDRLVPGKSDMVSAAEHDEIWLDTDCDQLAKVASEEDILVLVQCGVMYDPDLNSLHMFI